MRTTVVRMGLAAAVAVALVGFGAASAAAEEVTVGDVTVTVPGLTIDAGSITGAIDVGDDDDDGASGNSASAGSTSVSVFP